MASLMERVRNENPRSRRRTRVMTFEAPGGGRRKKSMPKLPINRARKKSVSKRKNSRKKRSSSARRVGDKNNEEMQKVVFSVALNSGKPD